MSRVNFAWDEDEPHRVRTLNQRFNPDQVSMLFSLIFPLKSGFLEDLLYIAAAVCVLINFHKS